MLLQSPIKVSGWKFIKYWWHLKRVHSWSHPELGAGLEQAVLRQMLRPGSFSCFGREDRLRLNDTAEKQSVQRSNPAPQFVLIQLLNQAGLCFPAEYDRNNNPKLARILHFLLLHEPGGTNETLEWGKELWFKSKWWEEGLAAFEGWPDPLSKGVWLHGFLSVGKGRAELAGIPQSPGHWNQLALLQKLRG